MYHRTSYDPLLDGPAPGPRHVDDNLSISDGSPVTRRRWSRPPLLGNTRRWLGGALVELGRLIYPELRPPARHRQAAQR